MINDGDYMTVEKTQQSTGVASDLNAELDQNLVKEGDKIALKYYYSKDVWEEEIFDVVYFRFALGVFISDDAKKAEHFTPLCDLYEKSESSTQEYIGNYGEYVTHKKPAWRIVEKKV